MKMLRINEHDQTIVDDIAVADYEPPNEFIHNLVADAVEHGEAVRNDAEGCPVTAVVWDA